MMRRFALSFRDRDLAALARALLVLGLAGASVAMAIEHWSGAWVTGFISGNTLPAPARRNLLLAGVGLGLCVGLATAAAVYFIGRAGAGMRRLGRAERLAAPLVLIGLVPGLMRTEAWSDPLTLSALLTAFLLALEPLWRLHFGVYGESRGGPRGGAGDRGRRPSPSPSSSPSPSFSLSSPSSLQPVWLARVLARLRAIGARVSYRLRPAVAWVKARRRPLSALSALSARIARMPPGVRRHLPAAIAVAMAVGYVAYMAFFAVRNHHRFNSFTWDLGQINNQFYNFLHGHPFRCTALIREGDWSELRNHAEATMFLLLPIYALYPSAETLLVLQAVLLGAAGLFLYRFAARRLSRPIALVVTAAYYLYPPLHGAQLFDIHFQPLAAAFLLAAIDCFDARRMRLFAVFFVFAIACREDISVGTAVFGLFLILTRHRARAGLVILLVSLAYFVAVRFVIMPAFGTWGFAEHYARLFPEGTRSFGGIIKTMLTNPAFTFTTLFTNDKLRYSLQILAPLAFLPLRRPHLALSILPGAFFTLLTTGYGPTLDIGYQYSGYFIPYIFPAAVLALEGMGKAPSGIARRRAAVATLIVATLIATAHWGAIPPRKQFHSSFGWVSFEPPTAAHIQQRRDLHQLERMVPKDAILAVTDREMPHVANRLECWNLSVGFKGADYIIYTSDHPISYETDQFNAALAAGYTRVADRPGLVLLKRPGAK